MRNSQSSLIARVSRLRQLSGIPYQLDMAYGGYRLQIADGAGVTNVSDRLNITQMSLLVTGMEVARENGI